MKRYVTLQNGLWALSVIGLFFLGFVLVMVLKPDTVPTIPATKSVQPVAEQKPATHPPTRAELLALVNQERARNGVAPLKEDARLDKSAQFKADDEVARHYYSHFDPVTGKKNGLDYLNNLFPGCVWVSENLTMGTQYDPNTAENDVEAWIGSAPHHKAMIDPHYTLTGFGIAGPYAVEHFCQSA